MAIKFSELKGLLKDTQIDTVKMSDPAYNIQLQQCTQNNWTLSPSANGMVNFTNINNLKKINRLDVTCLLCPSEVNIWVSIQNIYTNFPDISDIYLNTGLVRTLWDELNEKYPIANTGDMLSLFYVMSPPNGAEFGMNKDYCWYQEYNGARIMNYKYLNKIDTEYGGSIYVPFNLYSLLEYEREYRIHNVDKQIFQKNIRRRDQVLIGLGIKPDDNFTYSKKFDISVWVTFDYNTNITYTIRDSYRYNLGNYMDKFRQEVYYE